MIKYKRIRATIANGVAANTIKDAAAKLGAELKRCTGVSFIMVSNAGNTKVDLAILRAGNILLDTIPSDIAVTDTNVPVKDRFMEDVKMDDYADEEMTLRVTPLALTTAEIIVDVVFRMDTDKC